MRVLIEYSGNRQTISPFVKEQSEALVEMGVHISLFSVKGRGAAGYLKNLPSLKRKIEQQKPDLVHGHYGFCGLLGVLQRNVPVVVTFHGSDINVPRNRIVSFWAARLAKATIFVHPDLPRKIRFRPRLLNIIPCGVNIGTFHPIDRTFARGLLGMKLDDSYVLFSSSFDKKVKNYSLAWKAMDLLESECTLIELKGYTREQVNWFMSAVDAVLITSISETGPLVVKEAMACNCPIVSTDVGDVKWVIGNTPGCFLTSFETEDVAAKLKMALEFSEKHGRTQARERIIELGLDSETIAKRIIGVYESVLAKNA